MTLQTNYPLDHKPLFLPWNNDLTGERVSAAVVPSLCTTEVPGSIPVHGRALCAFGYSRSILALAGFLRDLRFPPAIKIGD